MGSSSAEPGDAAHGALGGAAPSAGSHGMTTPCPSPAVIASSATRLSRLPAGVPRAVPRRRRERFSGSGASRPSRFGPGHPTTRFVVSASFGARPDATVPGLKKRSGPHYTTILVSESLFPTRTFLSDESDRRGRRRHTRSATSTSSRQFGPVGQRQACAAAATVRLPHHRQRPPVHGLSPCRRVCPPHVPGLR
jgi:hypothetical protein